MKAAVLFLVLLVATVIVYTVNARKVTPQEPHYQEGEHNEKYHGSDPATLIESTIKSHDIVIFSKSYCPYCRKTKAFFENMNLPFHVLELDQHPQGSEIQQALLGTFSFQCFTSLNPPYPVTAKTGQRTVPNVFVKGALFLLVPIFIIPFESFSRQSSQQEHILEAVKIHLPQNGMANYKSC